MRKLILSLLILFIGCSFIGCGSLPKVYSVDSEREFNAPLDIIWEGVIDFFTGYSIPIKTIEKDSGLIYAENQYSPSLAMASQDPSAFYGWADCGKIGLFAKPLGTSLSLNIFVRDHDQENQTTVSINVVFSGIAPKGLSVPCNSTGKLEEAIFQHIGQYLLQNITSG